MSLRRVFVWLLAVPLIAGAFLWSGGATLPALAQEADPQGRPTQLFEGAGVAYWIWYDDDGFHVRTTTARARHVFSGWVDVDAVFTFRSTFRLEASDFLRRRGDRLEFRFVTRGGIDGFDFQTRAPHRATFFLEIDGAQAAPRRVFIGRGNDHPSGIPFTLRARRERFELEGRPVAFAEGQVTGYFIWREGNVYHVRTTTTGTRHVFSGVIEVNRGIVVERPFRLERLDFIVEQGGRIMFHLVTGGGADGFDFRVTAPHRVEFTLLLDGREDIASRIFLGRRGEHPDSNNFTIGR